MGWLNWSKNGQYVYVLDYKGAVVRIRISNHRTERVVDLKNLVAAGRYDGSLTLAPDDSPLLLRYTGTQDIFALKQWIGRTYEVTAPVLDPTRGGSPTWAAAAVVALPRAEIVTAGKRPGWVTVNGAAVRGELILSVTLPPTDAQILRGLQVQCGAGHLGPT